MSSSALKEAWKSLPCLHEPTCKPKLERIDDTRSSEFVMTPTIGLDRAESPSEDSCICRKALKNGKTSGYNVYPAAELKRVNRSGISCSGRPFFELKGRNVARMIYVKILREFLVILIDTRR